MVVNFYPKRIIRFLGISLFLSLTLFESNIVNKHVKAEKNFVAATEKDLFLYRQMGASYLCIASKAEVEFSKGLGNKKLTQKKLYNSGTFQIVGGALNICPESIPKKIKKDYEKKLKQIIKETKK